MKEYKVIDRPAPPHGNVKRALPFHTMKVDQSIEVPPEDYGRVNSARAHFTKKMRAAGNKIRITSRAVKENGRVLYYVFTRVE